jgi:hypothetical protein
MKENIKIGKDGKMEFSSSKKPAGKNVLKSVAKAQVPFTKLVDEIMASIAKFFEVNKDGPMSGKEMSVLVVGALAFVTGHYFSFLKSNTDKDLDKHEFANEFSKQIEAAIDAIDGGRKI